MTQFPKDIRDFNNQKSLDGIHLLGLLHLHKQQQIMQFDIAIVGYGDVCVVCVCAFVYTCAKLRPRKTTATLCTFMLLDSKDKIEYFKLCYF